eukprot:TRINITY_DN746_c0_g1_i3.p1 TRINITY_DN746_c0_g1~~TRINITY_DN746_c0_g1_i3.p1  ORF type:complete len:164 (-),score=13.06 TRINITY_DN746_c0_g1_i3:310-801(-)
MCTPTTLDLWETLKLEDIFASMYIVKCDLIYKTDRQRGELQPATTKFSNGTLLFTILMIIILGPLLLFSTAAPGNSNNNVLSATISIALDGNTNIGQTNILDITATRNISQAGGTVFQDLSEKGLLQDDPKDTIQVIEMVPYADTVFLISQPSFGWTCCCPTR